LGNYCGKRFLYILLFSDGIPLDRAPTRLGMLLFLHPETNRGMKKRSGSSPFIPVAGL
jgi:hypothetical protein